MGKTSKRLLSLAIALVMVLSMVPAGGLQAEAASEPIPMAQLDKVLLGQKVKTAALALQNNEFKDKTTAVEAKCPVCNDELKTWLPLDAATLADGEALADGHYYIAEPCTTMTGSITPGAATCLLLNGKDLTSTNRVFLGGSGIFNIMGTGNVIGKTVDGTANKAIYGGTVQINTIGLNGTINLYGGTYKNGEGCDTGYVVSIANNGGRINIFDGVLIEGSTTAAPVYIGQCSNSSSKAAVFGMYGGTVDGTKKAAAAIYCVGTTKAAIHSGGDYKMILAGGTVKGNTAASETILTTSSNARYGTLEMYGGTVEGGSIHANEGKATVKISGGNVAALKVTATAGTPSITITGGTFSFDPSDYAACVTKNTEEDTWTVNGGSHTGDADACSACGVVRNGYSVEKPFAASLESVWCDDCNANIPVSQWQAVSSASTELTQGHYYLANTLNTTAAIVVNARGNDICVHLNGNNITQTTSGRVPAIRVEGGHLSIMGNGIVSGYSDNWLYGGAVHVDGNSAYATAATADASADLYGGTYQVTGNTTAVSVGNYGVYFGIHGRTHVTGATTCVRTNVFAQKYAVITGGTIDSYLRTQNGNGQYIISGGNFTNTNALTADSAIIPVVTGGTFAHNPANYTSTGCIVENSGKWTVYAGHALEQSEAKEATCTEPGRSTAVTCVNCAQVFSDAEVIPAKPHTWVDNTCTTCQGVKLEITCEHGCEDPAWKPLPSSGTLTSGHYYVEENMTVTETITTAAGSKVCVLNDKEVSSTGDVSIFQPAGEFSLMGEGSMRIASGNTKVGAVKTDAPTADVYIYGGTYGNTANVKRGCITLGENGGSVTIKGGTFERPIMLWGGAGEKKANLTIEDGEFNSTNAISAVFVHFTAAPSANITIKGGTYNSPAMIVTAGSNLDSSNLTWNITGGSFRFNPVAYLPDGYGAKLEEGMYVVKNCAEGHDFPVGGGACLNGCGYNNGLECEHGCTGEIVWTPVKDTMELGNGHYILAASFEGQITVAAGATACLHLNGKDLTHATQAILVDKAGSELSIMGNGNVSVTAAGGNTAQGAAVVNAPAAGAAMNIYGGTYTTNKTDRGAVVAGDYSTLKIYDGTVNGPIMVKDTNNAVEIHGGDFTSSLGIFNGYNLTGEKNISILGGTFHSELLQYPGSTEMCRFDYENMPEGAIEGGKFATNPNMYTGDLCADKLESGYWQVSEDDCEDWYEIDGSDTLICAKCEKLIGDAVPGMTAIVYEDYFEFFSDAQDAMDAYAGEGYIKVFGDSEIEIADDTIIDANGYKVTVTGSGKVSPMDAANDSYVSYGRFYIEGDVTIERDVTNPVNGRRYITIDDTNNPVDSTSEFETFYTTHRVEITLTNVTLRTSAAGMYYKAEYKCDNTLAELVDTYGVAVGRDKVPDKYFEDAENVGVSAIVGFTPDENHAVKGTSGALFGLMKEGYTAANNKFRAETVIYANAYFRVNVTRDADPSNDLVVVGDEVNDGTSNGVGHSLLGLLQYIDAHWTEYADYQDTVNEFYNKWISVCSSWEFENIGK